MASADKTYATGKRKLAICRAWGHSGSGQITVNGFGINSAEKRIAMATNCFDLEFAAG